MRNSRATLALIITIFICLSLISSRSYSLDEAIQSIEKESDSPQYLKCTGVFVEYEQNYDWWEDTPDGGHSDFVSQKATFKIVSPQKYADREVGVVFENEEHSIIINPKSRIYIADDDPITDLPKSKLGKTFIFEIPEDFFTGNYGTISNLFVNDIRVP